MIWDFGENDQNIIEKDNTMHFFYLALGTKKYPMFQANNLMISQCVQVIEGAT